MFALLLAAAALLAPHEQFVAFFSKLMKEENPFAAAPHLAERMLSRGEGTDETSALGVRGYDDDGCFVELGPFNGRTPRKIMLVAAFVKKEEAIAYLREVSAAIHTTAQPPLPPEVTGPLNYRGTILIARRPVGLELDLTENDNRWRATVTLIAAGPRTLVPLTVF